ncbi:MAG: adenylate kinase [Dehalococcoidia bacterium]|nr:adenylate kinase [Dehalococcoidia bacterium]
MYVVMLGGPGAGKGTQSAIVSQEMNLPHVASGDLFRQALEQQTELGLLAKSYMDEGELGPDEIVTKMILERIDSPDCASGCLFDGFPRTLVQAEALDGILAERGEAVDAAVYIKVSEAELVKRLSGRWICRQCQTPYHVATSPPAMVGKCDKCGGQLYQRSDDNEETVRKRLKVFFSQTVPILDYYRKQGKLLDVSGNLGIAEVSKEILCALRGREAQ